MAEHESVAAAGADQETISAVSAYKDLLSGQTKCSIGACGLGARCERVITLRTLLQGRHDKPVALHHALQLRMRYWRLRKHRRRNCREPDRLAHQTTARLFKHQSQFGKAQTKPVCRIRDENSKPSEFGSLPQPGPRETRILLARRTGHLGARSGGEFSGAVAQQALLRCEMQVHDDRLP